MTKTIYLLLILNLLTWHTSYAQENGTIAKIEFQMAEEAYEKKQYAETREHIKKVEDLLKQQTPKTRYLDIMAHSKILKLENFTFSDNNLGIQKDLDQLNLFFVSSNDFIKKYSNIIPEEKTKEIYQLNILVSKSIESGKKVFEALNKYKIDIFEKYANFTVDSNKTYDIQFTKKVGMLVDKFRPGTNFIDALYEIDKINSTGLKDKLLNKLTGKGSVNNFILPQQNTEQLLSNPYREFLQSFKNEKVADFVYPDNDDKPERANQYGAYDYKNFALTFKQVRSTYLSPLKFDKIVKLEDFKVEPSIRKIFIDESNIISAVYLDFPVKKVDNELNKDFISWMGGAPLKYVSPNGLFIRYTWYLNNLTIMFGYRKKYKDYDGALSDMFILVTHTDKKMSKLYDPIRYNFENRIYTVYLK
jgi:hypothetical protein